MEPDLTIGLVRHHAFCPRRAWLEANGENTDTGQMAKGVDAHRATDDPTTGRKASRRSVDVRSERLGVVGRCDTLELDEEGGAQIVEHKATPVRRKPIASESQRIQLALQALCLREGGHNVNGASIWFSDHAKRVNVDLDRELFDQAEREVEATRETLGSAQPPPPLEDDDRCHRCSHVSVCLPDEHRARMPARTIAVEDPTGRVLHLSTPGSRARRRRGQIEITSGEESPQKVPLGQIAGLMIHGNADVSSALLRELLYRGLPVIWCTWSGRVIGWAVSAGGPNGDSHRLQHRLPPDRAVEAARQIVSGKIRNQRYLLRRHQLDGRAELTELAKRALSADDPASLFGIEGRAAAIYFAMLKGALRPDWATFPSRKARPARDAVNASLDVTYSLLLSDVLAATTACGLDPAGGVLHSPSRNKPALALDLMEEFRPLIADSTVAWAINNGEIRPSHFRTQEGVVRMSQSGRKKLIAAYERRVGSEFKHPRFGYRVTWRRAMEVQARLFLAFVRGSVEGYEPVVVR